MTRPTQNWTTDDFENLVNTAFIKTNGLRVLLGTALQKTSEKPDANDELGLIGMALGKAHGLQEEVDVL